MQGAVTVFAHYAARRRYRRSVEIMLIHGRSDDAVAELVSRLADLRDRNGDGATREICRLARLSGTSPWQ